MMTKNRLEAFSDGVFAIYSGVLLVAAISFTLLYAWILHDDRITGFQAPADVIRAARMRFGIGVLFY